MILCVRLLVFLGYATLIINGHPFQRNAPDEDGEGATCWPKLQQIAGNIIDISKELKPLIHLLYENDRVDRPEKAKEEISWIACQLEEIHSISDLVNFVKLVPEEKVRELYAAFQMGWRALGGMDTVYALGEVLNKDLQLTIDINFPNEIPVTSMSQEKLQIRLTEIRNGIPPAILGLMLADGVDMDQQIQLAAEACFESANYEEFADTMNLPPGALTILQTVRASAPALKKLVPFVVELIEELHKHGLMDLQ